MPPPAYIRIAHFNILLKLNEEKYQKTTIYVETISIENPLAASSVTPHLDYNGAVMEEWEEQEVELGRYEW